MKRAIMIAALLCAGCAGTPEGVRENPGAQPTRFTRDENYQAVYRRLLAQARKCWAEGPVEANLYQDTRTGEIAMALYGFMGGRTIFLVIDIAADGDKTRVIRSEERRVGKGCRWWWARCDVRK